MPAGGYRTFIAGEVLDQNDINDYLMQGMLVFAGSAARGSAIGTAVEGQFSFLTDTDTIEYFDGTNWVELETGVPNLVATGGNGTATSGGYTYHAFTSTGDLVVTQGGICEALLVGGGGGGGSRGLANFFGGGGGAGGVLYVTDLYIPAGTATVTVGAGGPNISNDSALQVPGGFSRLASATALGGGGGGAGNGRAGTGASGGGGGNGTSSDVVPGIGLAGQGNRGGYGDAGTDDASGGGGGAGAVGADGSGTNGGDGGAGISTYDSWISIVNTVLGATPIGENVSGTYWIAGGGGGAGEDGNLNPGGDGGGGNGIGDSGTPTSGTARTGGGGGGGEDSAAGQGGSGFVIVRYAV